MIAITCLHLFFLLTSQGWPLGGFVVFLRMNHPLPNGFFIQQGGQVSLSAKRTSLLGMSGKISLPAPLLMIAHGSSSSNRSSQSSAFKVPLTHNR